MRREDDQQDLFIEAPIWWEGLTGRRRQFVEYFCTDQTCFLNPTAAYIKAFSSGDKQPTDSSIHSNASRMMKDKKIKTAIIKLLRARQNEEDQINEYKILNQLKTLAFYDPKDILNQYGTIKKDLNELGNLTLCISGIRKTKNGTEIKLYDRTKALELLLRYLDMVRPVDGNTIINPVVCLTDKDMEALKEEDTKISATSTAQEAEYQIMDTGV